MEYLQNGLTLYIPQGCFPLSTDSIALADFTLLPKNARVLDLGAGCGTLGLLLCAKDTSCAVTGIELTETAHKAAVKNIEDNRLSSRLTSICADMAEVSKIFPPGSFRVCLSNPPYYAAGPQSQTTPLARREDACDPDVLFQAAAWAVQYGGDLFLVHKPERLAALCSCADRHGFAPKRLRLLRHKEGGPVSLILLQCRKGGKPGLLWEEVCLHDREGAPTDYYKQLYHLQGD